MLFAFCLILCQYQPGVAYKSVAYTKKARKRNLQKLHTPAQRDKQKHGKGVILMTLSNQEVILDKMTNQRIHNDIDQNIQLTFKYYIPVFEI